MPTVEPASPRSLTSKTLHITIAEGNVTSDAIDDTPNLVAESVSNADSGTQMRIYGSGYIYNFSTKKLVAAGITRSASGTAARPDR